MFDYPTVAAISGYLTERLAPPQLPGAAGEAAVEPQPAATLVPAQQGEQQLVLVAGIRSRLAQLPGSEPLAAAAVPAADPISPVILDRWDADFGRSIASFSPASRLAGAGSAGGLLGGRFGGFVLEWSVFDPEAFAIPPSEATLLDPQQRVLLEEAAGLLPAPDSPAGGNKASSSMAQQLTAVAVGIAKLGEPAVVAAGLAAATAAGSSYVGTGRALSAAAGRLSYCFGLKGPSGELESNWRVPSGLQGLSACLLAGS